MALLFFVGCSAAFGGVALLTDPRGALVGLPMSLLDSSPFADYRVPGFALLLLVGLSNLAAAFAVVYRSVHARALAILAAVLTMGFVVIELASIRTGSPLQLVYFSAASAVIALARHRFAR
jgi:hypothetical protein